MKTILENLDYSTDWTWTGKYRDGRKEFKRCMTFTSEGDYSCDSSFTMLAVNEAYFDSNEGSRWSNNFYDGATWYAIASIVNNKVRIKCNRLSSVYVVLIGW